MEVKEVSVIIPTLNEEFFISSCLDSVFAQSYPMEQLNIMVIDGGSKDRTREIVLEYAEKNSNICLLDNPGKIQSIAFNIGVEVSDSPYVIRLDAHALYDERYIELCVKKLKSHPEVGNVGGRWEIRSSRKGLIPEANAILNQVSFGIGGASFRVGAEPGYVDTVPFGAFSRKVLQQVGGMREDLVRGEDNEFNSRIRWCGYKIYFDPNIVCTYFARPTLFGSMKQMYANGHSIGFLFYIDKQSVGLRHLVPLFFVLSLIVCWIMGFFVSVFFYLLYLCLGLYFFAAIMAAIFAGLKFGLKYVIILPIIFFCIHISYGCGTIIGLLKGIRNIGL